MAIDAKAFLEAVEELEVAKGIRKEVIFAALQEAITKSFKKQIGGDDAEVIVNIDPENGTIEMFHLKNIVKEVQDDFLEVDSAEAKVLVKEEKAKIVDDKVYIPASVEDFKKAAALSVKSIMKQKYAEEEKAIITEQFSGKIGTIITGKVEKSDERGVSVNIGRTSVFVPKNQLIGDERFSNGESIRLYVNGVESGTKGGARIGVTRANEGFLKCLFNEEIREIYDGTIEIKNIARDAGERSKVAVWTNNPDVDPAGACIGQNGTRIQKIVSQLGNGNAKEKIDIIAYSDNPGLYIIESLKPARIAGVIVNEGETKSAIAIVKDDSLSLAIGRRGVNVRLAVKLTGYKIDIKTEADALSEGLQYQTIEELQAKEMELKAIAIAEAKAAAAKAQAEANVDVLPGLPEGYVAPQARAYEEETNDFDEVIASQVEDEVIESSKPVNEDRVDVEEEVKPVVEAKKEAVKEEKVEVKAVKTTTTLSDLEKALEDDSKKKEQKGGRKNYSRKKKDEEEAEDATSTPITNDPSKYMSIYTEEELREMEREDAESADDVYEEDDVDYDEYDEYYDDEN